VGSKLKILVTGGAGFIGSHLVDRLVEGGHDVTVFDDFSRGSITNINSMKWKVKVFPTDVSCSFVMPKVDMVYHLAADSIIEQDNANSYKRNVLGTLNLLQEMVREGVNKVVFASSASVYGGTKRTISPIVFYGASKMACEQLIKVYSIKYHIDYWIYRFGNVIGSRMNHGVIHDFLQQYKKHGELRMHGDGSQVRSFIHVDDLLSALVTSEQRCHGVYDIASRDSINITKVAEIVQNVLKLKELTIKHLPRWQGDVDYCSPNSSKLEGTGWKATMNSEQSVRKATEDLAKEILGT
jgi:UDP-glucose 4-epimerase